MDEEVAAIVQRIFSMKLKGADLGGKMYVQRVNNGKRIPYYTCAQYGKIPVESLCLSGQRIRESIILGFVSDML